MVGGTFTIPAIFNDLLIDILNICTSGTHHIDLFDRNRRWVFSLQCGEQTHTRKFVYTDEIVPLDDPLVVSSDQLDSSTQPALVSQRRALVSQSLGGKVFSGWCQVVTIVSEDF